MPGLPAHAIHLLLVVVGLASVAVLLLPQVRAGRSRRTTEIGQLTRTPVAAGLALHWSGARDGSTWRAVAVGSSVAAAGVHAAVFPQHLDESWAVGMFFLGVTMAQAAWACLVALGATDARLVAGILGSLGLIALWAVSRTVGLPFGLGREGIGAWDLAAGGWELAVVIACLVGLGRPRGPRARVLGALGGVAWSWLLLCATALLALALTASSHG